MTERARPLLRRAGTRALWLGPEGLWDYGTPPGWAAALRRGGPHGRPASAPAAHASFDAWCQQHAGQACSLVVSAWWLHELLIDAALPLADDRARLAYARGLLQHYHGDGAALWPLAAWSVAGRCGVSALHGANLEALQASARHHAVRLRAVRPWWSQALRMALQQRPALAQAPRARLLLADGPLVSQIDLAQGRLLGLQQRRLPQATGAALLALCDQCALAGQVADGAGDAAGTERVHVLGHGLTGSLQLPASIVALGPLDGAAPASLWRLPVDQRAMADAAPPLPAGDAATAAAATAAAPSRLVA